MKQMIYKLQKGIVAQGHKIKVETIQFFSEEQHRYITKYVISEPRPYINKKGEHKYKDEEVFSSCSAPAVVQFLAGTFKSLAKE